MPDIIDTADIAESNYEPSDREPSGDDELRTSAVASHEEKPGGISFHVQMRDWTVNDMEELIIEAAARMVVGRTSDNKLSKLIEDRAMSLITERADARLSAVASDVLGTTLTPKGYDQKTPVTIGETIGMLGREYLEQMVGSDGKPATDSYGRNYGTKRLEYIVRAHMDHKFSEEIKTATSKFIIEVRNEIRARHEQMLAAEKARIAEALTKL